MKRTSGSTKFIGCLLGIIIFAASFFAYRVGSYTPEPSVNPPGKTVQTSLTNKSISLAKEHWTAIGVKTPCGKIPFLVVDHIPNLRGIDADGGSRAGICLVEVTQKWYDAAVSQPQRFCALTVHEVGHIDGLDHSPDRSDVMHLPQYVVPRICRRL